MQQILSVIISKVVEYSDKVSVSEQEENGIITYTITVAKEDMGKIIGKSGRMIKAIRNVMKIPAIKNNKRINIALQEYQ